MDGCLKMEILTHRNYSQKSRDEKCKYASIHIHPSLEGSQLNEKVLGNVH